VFPTAIFLGAFLLFQIQPLIGKAVLPWFGGGPAVWTTGMLFFQAVLFGGYAYAHLSERVLGPRVRVVVHLVLIGAALCLLPISPREAFKPADNAHPAGALLLVLAASVGAPYFLLSSTGPLVQAWFARTFPGRSPFRLYALSNAGSLAGLLTYPFVAEPLWGLRTQSRIWTAAFAGFAALSAAGLLLTRGAAPAETVDDEPPPSRLRIAAWMILPGFASALLVASTNQLCSDIAVIPFLWVLPLAAYLVTFIIAFDRPAWASPDNAAPAAVLLTFIAAGAYYTQPHSTLGVAMVTAANVAALFATCLLCHGALAALKPAPSRLTGYYLAMSGGAALGSLLVSLVAPLVFSTTFEWKLGTGISYIGAVAAAGWSFRGVLRAHRNVAAILLVVVTVCFAFLVALITSYSKPLETARNFYGAVAVNAVGGVGPEDGEARDLINGRVLHGRQFLCEKYRREPTTYYMPESGVGRALARVGSRPDLKVGVVGLGVGTIAAYGKSKGQTFRFYDINPDVPRLAERHFTYLKDCAARVEIVLGDARLSLEREPPQQFHVLALDAFSGHTVPAHLLTVEAMRIYRHHLRDDGVVAMHVSNQFLRLGPVVRASARACGMRSITVECGADEKDLGMSSTWVLCTSNEAVAAELAAFATENDGDKEILWTDDANDLLSVLKR
jgi:hypothetical protein